MQNMVLLHWENDIFLHTDYYFTNGAAVEFISPAVRIKAMDKLLYMPLKNGFASHSISIRQNMYTPEKMFETDVQWNDRPYAGYFIGEYKLSQETKRKKFSSGLSIGMLGEYSLAARTQDFVHSLDEMVPAAGWQYQVKMLLLSTSNRVTRKCWFEIPYSTCNMVSMAELVVYTPMFRPMPQ